MITITARRDCRYCHGSGTVYDTVDYGSTTASMPSDCEDCVTAGWPEGADGDEDYEIVPVPSVWGDTFGSSQGDLLVTDAEREQEDEYWAQRDAERQIEHDLEQATLAQLEAEASEEYDDGNAPTVGNETW